MASKARILILEDDDTLGKALAKALTKELYAVTHLKRPDEALLLTKKEPFDVIIVDGLLSGMTGVDFSIKIREEFGKDKPQIIFMSGVFTDKKFIKDTTTEINALSFFKKPFDINDLVTLINNEFEEKGVTPQKALNLLLAQPEVSVRQIRRAIEAIEEISGYELPFIYSLLVETKSSGHLNVVDSQNRISGLTFSKGYIVGADTPEKDTLMGQMLIKQELITPDELDLILAKSGTRKIGDRLIEENLLSPHAFRLVLEEQMNLRLSRRIGPEMCKLTFVSAEVEYREPNIDPDHFETFVHDWVTSKISLEWLNNYYRAWEDHKIIAGPSYSDDHTILKLPLMQRLPGLLPLLTSGKTLATIFESKKLEVEEIIRALHLLMLRRVIVFESRASTEEDQFKKNRLGKIYSEIGEKNYFQVIEMMGVAPTASEAELTRGFEDFKKMINPDDNSNREYKDLADTIITKVTEAYKVVVDPKQRAEYRRQLDQEELKIRIEAEKYFDAAKVSLKKGLGDEAIKSLLKIIQIKPDFPELKVYLCWAKLTSSGLHSQREKLIKEIEFDLLQVPPEERYNALYAYVAGLHFKLLGNTIQAKKNFEKAAYLDPMFVEAKRELNIMSIQDHKPKEFDITSVVSGLLKKKR